MLNEILKSLAKELGTFLNWKKWKKKNPTKNQNKIITMCLILFQKSKTRKSVTLER